MWDYKQCLLSFLYLYLAFSANQIPMGCLRQNSQMFPLTLPFKMYLFFFLPSLHFIITFSVLPQRHHLKAKCSLERPGGLLICQCSHLAAFIRTHWEVLTKHFLRLETQRVRSISTEPVGVSGLCVLQHLNLKHWTVMWLCASVWERRAGKPALILIKTTTHEFLGSVW